MLPAFPTERSEKRRFLLDAVESVSDTVSACADEAERIGTLPRAAVDAIRDAGLFALKLPRELGGAEADPVMQTEVIEALSYADAAAGWCLMIGATAIGRPGAFLHDEAIAHIFKGGRVPTASTITMPAGRAIPVDGGYMLSGRWSFLSGVPHSEWICAGALAYENGDDAPTSLSLVFPTSVAHIHNNWQVAGLRGTGSNDVSVSELFVPKAFTWDSSCWQSQRGGALYRMGRPGFVVNEHAGFALGVAQRALDEIVASAPAKRRGNPPTSLADRQAFRGDIGGCDLRLRAARSLSLEVFGRAFDIACGGSIPDNTVQAEMRATSKFATDVALDVVTTAFRYAGGSAIYNESILQRCLRDINAAAQHFMVSSTALEHHGAALLGVPDIAPMG